MGLTAFNLHRRRAAKKKTAVSPSKEPVKVTPKKDEPAKSEEPVKETSEEETNVKANPKGKASNKNNKPDEDLF